MRTAFLLGGGLAVALALGFGGYRVLTLERGELDAASPWTLLAPTTPEGGPEEPHRELVQVELEVGEEVYFELCSRDRMPPHLWSGALEIAVWHPATRELALRVPVDDDLLAAARRSAAGSCVVFAHTSALAEGGLFAIEAVWPDRELPEALTRVPIRLRVLADRRLRAVDRWLVVLLMVGALLLVLGVARRRRARSTPRQSGGGLEPAEEADPEPRASVAASGSVGLDVARLLAGVTGFVAFGMLLGLLPFGGAVAGLVRGLLLAAAQIALALALSGHLGRSGAERLRAGLGLTSPSRAAWALWLSPAIGALLWLGGRGLLALVPSTGEAPIETLVAWPSGELAVSLAGVLVPVAEEVFFRGFVYGTVARRFGQAAAFVLTVVLFTAAHLPQVWGAWGGLAAIALTGLGLTALRAWTGSTLAPTLAHVTHNGAISILAALL